MSKKKKATGSGEFLSDVAELRKRGQDPETKQCPECLSEIPHGAHKCAFCQTEQPAQA